MLDCRRDRLDYGEQLQPPSGYRLDRAVASTYSADLGALLSIPVALVYAQTMEGDLSGARFQLLKAIEEFSSRVRVYHQEGQLHVPQKLNWLYAHLEDALAPILPDDAFTAFHPKMWVIRFVPDEKDEEGAEDISKPSKFRIIVLSRNLTFDRSWDIAATLNGEPGESFQRNNQPIIDFVRWLHRQRPIDWVEGFLEELGRVEFETPEGFDSHFFHPMGIPGYGTSPLDGLQSNRTVVLSPFLSPKTIERLLEGTHSDLNLFSRAHELAKLPVDLLNQIQSYSLSDLIVDGEAMEAAEDGSIDVKEQELHAKVFVMKPGDETCWFLGSANATEAARERNVELMLELRGTSNKSRIYRLLNELRGEKEGDGPFFSFEPEEGGKEDAKVAKQEAEARRFEYAILKAPIEAKIERSENGKTFDLFLELDLRGVPVSEELQAKVLPFNVKSKPSPVTLSPGTIQRIEFRNLGEVELSRFLHFRIEGADEAYHEFLVRIEIANLPADRLENILRKIIDSSDKFFEYLRFLLADEVTKEDLLATGAEDAAPEPQDGHEDAWQTNLPIYEQLLVVASRDPRRLKEVDEIIRHLSTTESEEEELGGEPIIPAAFLSFWEAFRDLIPEKERSSTS
ncbi:MAG: phospholipase D family protein [Verrucomicrobiales bacterium]|nr:phospholipase D family protein [Verrucomicrobiales bacterium]